MATTFKPPTTPTGRVSEVEYGMYLDEWFADTPPELLYPLNIQTYSAMRRDSSVAAIQQGYTLQLRRAQWQLDGHGCDPEVTQMVADDMGLPILGDDQPGAARTRGVSWSEHLRVALSQALTFGHSGFALGADVSSGDARLNVLAERPPWTINEIHVDPVTGAFLGVTQDGISKPDVPQIKARNMAWYCLDREGANWAGRSMYYSAWLPWLIKREMIRVHATSNRRWGAGVPVMEALPGTNPGSGEMLAAAAMASAARAGEQAGAASPPGFQLKILGLSGSVPDTLGFIEWLDRQITRASLMSHLELGQGSTGGAYALGAAFIDSWVLALETLGESIADTATRQIAARIVEWNRGEDEPVPRVTVAGVGSRREVTAESLQLLLTSGGLSADPALEAWVRREYRLPEREPTPVVAPGATLPGQPGAVAPDGTAMPATAASTDDGLIAAALAAANARNWGALDETAAQMQTRETATTNAGNPDPQWAEIADDEGEDWKVDAALARGADVASAYKSIYGASDGSALQRGFDVWAADQQVAGTPTAGTVDDFKALVTAAPAPNLTLDLDNRVVAVAVRLGRFSALIGQPITTCPYKGPDAEQTALRRVWITSYLRLRSATATTPAPAAAPADATTKPAADPTTAPPNAQPVKASTRVIAAAGHPNSCAHATLGSVCHCACAGVRHGWLGTMPSGVKTAQNGGAPGGGGNTAPSTPALDGLSGFKAPAGLNGEKAPAPASAPASGTPAPAAEDTPAPAAEPAPPAPLTFDQRLSEALTGEAANASVPLSLDRTDNLPSEQQVAAFTTYRGINYRPINEVLRSGDPTVGDRWHVTPVQVQGWVDAMDAAMDESQLPQEITTWRGLGGRALFGAAFTGDLTGVEWREDAYSSTSTDRDMSAGFATDAGSSATLMRLVVPAGVGAVELSDSSFESEVLLDRDLGMRVVADHGVDDAGIRHLDIEVIPHDERAEARIAEEGAGEGQDVGEGQAGGGLQPADSDPAEGRTDPGVDPAEGLTPAPADGGGSYDERSEAALQEVAARQSTPLSRRRSDTRALLEDENDVLEEYMGNGFLPINHLLRGGDPSSLDQWDHGRDEPLTEDLVNSWTGAIDSLMAESRLPQSIVTWRGMRNGDTLFGEAFGDDLTGAEWRDDAFASTSSDESIASDFALDQLGNAEPGSTVMHVLVPPGTGAVELSDELYESEVLLDRGLRYRVVTDWGINDNGVRVLDVEVVSDAG